MVDDDDTVLAPARVAQPFVCGDARHMHTLDDGTVALVVTSPPYFAGKQYEQELDGRRTQLVSRVLDLLHDVFAEA